MAMNLSIRHFQRNDFVDRLCEILDKYKFKENSISFQIMNDIDVSKVEAYKIMFDRIKEKGIKLTINNYEVRYETMDVFKRLPIDEVKVNSEYLMSNSIFDTKVLGDIVNLSKDLKYDVVVTKVSNDNMLKEILKYDVDMLQGNHLFEIIAEENLPQFLDKYNEYKGDIKKIIKSEKR